MEMKGINGAAKDNCGVHKSHVTYLMRMTMVHDNVGGSMRVTVIMCLMLIACVVAMIMVMVVFTHDGSVNERTTRSDLVEMKWLNFATPDDKVSDSLQQRNPFACKE